MSLLFVVSIALILLFVLFSLYYLIASKREVPHQSLLEEEFDQEE
ncbi:ABC transporter ATP-binding protein [Bacillus sp. NPDC077411]|uniref:ABC transporter ATP-binding protein n=1 Tax=Bacillus bruguierae TaxID=3127667 RepID=A0ABU8FEM3_9BACI|nr:MULTISPECIES: ABC transporter ATP-binding protein [unclassified Bacillus (in: firmicutes)]